MKKTITILVPTDFSASSRAGMRFAIQWTRQQKVKLVFVHVLSVLRLTGWSDKQYEAYAAAQRTLYSRRLTKLAAEVCRQMGVPKYAYATQLIEGISADITLTELSGQRPDIDLICMATRGAGKLKKFFGTHTGNLILRSEIPVIAVPAGYRAKPIKRILYATDLADSEDELGKILNITRPLNAEVVVTHFPQPGETILNPALVNATWEKQFGYPVKLRYESADPGLSLAENLQGLIGKMKPSLVVMFTDRQRTPFQRLFYPSQTERLSFQLKVPLLVLGKKE
jgi:nucleotide-binding universal stress UspA family protein